MVPRGQPPPLHAPLAGPQLPPALSTPRLRCPLAGPPTTRSSIAGLEETEGGFALAAAPSLPLVGPLTTQSSIVGLEETEGSSAPAYALDRYRAPLAGRSAPPASSRPINFTRRRTSIYPKQQRDVVLKAHVASVHFKCFRCFKVCCRCFIRILQK